MSANWHQRWTWHMGTAQLQLPWHYQIIKVYRLRVYVVPSKSSRSFKNIGNSTPHSYATTKMIGMPLFSHHCWLEYAMESCAGKVSLLKQYQSWNCKCSSSEVNIFFLVVVMIKKSLVLKDQKIAGANRDGKTVSNVKRTGNSLFVLWFLLEQLQEVIYKF